MKLVIRGEKPEEPEEVIEVWLEIVGGMICVRSKSSKKDYALDEVNIHSDRTITLIGNGNFRVSND